MDFSEMPMESLPKNITSADRLSISAAVTLIEAEPGNVLGGDDIVNTIPKFSDGWKPVPYSEKLIVNSKTYSNSDYNEDGSPKYELESIEDIHLEVYHHALYQGIVNSYLDSNGQTVEMWNAYDIPFEPNWRMISAKYMGGISPNEIAIVRLLRDMANASSNYLSMYMMGNMLSSTFSQMRRQERERIELAEKQLEAGSLTMKEYNKLIHPDPLVIAYNENYCIELGGAYLATVHAFRYAYELNERKPFSIIEQIYDNRNGGRNREILSKYDPKTEIREEFNIFQHPGYPESVYTNMRPQIFVCDFKKGDFVITCKR